MVYVLSELLFLLIEISECVGSDSNQANILTLSTFSVQFSVCFLPHTYIIRTNTYTYHPELFRHTHNRTYLHSEVGFRLQICRTISIIMSLRILFNNWLPVPWPGFKREGTCLAPVILFVTNALCIYRDSFCRSRIIPNPHQLQSSGRGIRTPDLRVMNPASCQTALSRDIFVFLCYITKYVRVIYKGIHFWILFNTATPNSP